MNSPFSHNSGSEEHSDRTWGLGLPWGPPAELDELVDRLGRWVDRATGGRGRGARWTPVVEEDETAGTYRVRVELPGIPRDRVFVEVEGHQLCVRGDLEEGAAGANSYLAARAGSFAFRTTLPADADREDVRADLADGVLTVTVPRSGPTSRTTVPISGK
ncbi:Hsp20/alpha crystallin family protein [Catenulispora sp. NF23]|uniref:Hsp20/alpha crystallin family protein n=1 Tax=Catenulispora pinistramenti TaxID=2705254 RepID=A0ABS5KL67_9ACTN|nr:Hsp20/alpha crystallin family protein [Catenulispora pinistramenti]MBS2531510.1 Hsp20/alpha crystallin family protein [Catenulispora pinistramenti]MBS2546779.1 Hsp20/alpha crystallin family protein [Catenulispora pinistramenti]